jgi:hypothetical protein
MGKKQLKSSKKNNNRHLAKNTEMIIKTESVREETIRWIFCLVASLLTYLVIAFCIVNFYHPDIESLIEKSKQISFLTDFQPEPVESMLFQTGLLIIPLTLLLFYWLSLKSIFLNLFRDKKLFNFSLIVAIIAIVSLIFIVFNAQNPFFNDGSVLNEHDKLAKTNFQFFFLELTLNTNPLLYLLFFFPLIFSICIFLIRTDSNILKKMINGIILISGSFVSLLLIVAIASMNTYEFPSTWQAQYDFNAVYYSMTQVYAGCQMLVDGFTNTYGLYPHFLSPIFEITGLTVYNFTFTMSVMIASCFIFIFIFMKYFTKNYILLFLGFISTIILPYLANRLMVDFDSFFCLFPIRMICPSLVLLFTVLLFYCKNRNKKLGYTIIYYAGTILLAFTPLWNFEFGLVSFVAWLLMLSYSDFFLNNKIAWKKILSHWIIGLSALLFAFGLYALVQNSIYGQFPNFRQMLDVLTVFGKLGFFMLPISLWHPWMLTILIFILGLLYAIAKLIRRDITPKSSAIFLSAILGCGLFAYFQGRSHNWNLSVIILFAFICLTLLTDELWENIKTKKIKSFYALLGLCICLLSFSTVDAFNSASDIYNLAAHVAENKGVEKSQDAEKKKIEENKKFIDSTMRAGEKIFVLTSNKFQGLYFDGQKKQSAVNPGFLDMFYKSSIKQYEKVLKDSSFMVFWNPAGFYYNAFHGIRTIVSSDYKIVSTKFESDTVVSFAAMEKHNAIIPEQSFFESGEHSLYYAKYHTGDSLSYAHREEITNGSTIDSIADFQLDIIFRPEDQIYYTSTLLLLSIDTSTTLFVMKTKSLSKQNEYAVLVNERGFLLRFELEKWNYLSLQTQNNITTVFLNGNIIGRLALPYNRSNSPTLFVAGYKNGRYFTGSISEYSISRKIRSNQEIAEVWKTLNQTENKKD